MFQPPPSYEHGPATSKLETSAGERIYAAHLPDDDADYTVLFSHGNAADLGYELPTLRALRGLGFAVMGYDYAGYGPSEGPPHHGRGGTRARGGGARGARIEARGPACGRLFSHRAMEGTGGTEGSFVGK